MSTTQIDFVSVSTQAIVYFDGKSSAMASLSRWHKNCGVILLTTLTFNTGAPEIMECGLRLRVQTVAFRAG